MCLNKFTGKLYDGTFFISFFNKYKAKKLKFIFCHYSGWGTVLQNVNNVLENMRKIK